MRQNKADWNLKFRYLLELHTHLEKPFTSGCQSQHLRSFTELPLLCSKTYSNSSCCYCQKSLLQEQRVKVRDESIGNIIFLCNIRYHLLCPVYSVINKRMIHLKSELDFVTKTPPNLSFGIFLFLSIFISKIFWRILKLPYSRHKLQNTKPHTAMVKIMPAI